MEENNTLKSLQSNQIFFTSIIFILFLKDYEVTWNERVSENKCLHTLYNKNNFIYEKDNELQFTDLSWNSTGAILAIS